MDYLENDPPASLPEGDNNEFRELMRRVRKGSPEAVCALIRKYQDEMLDAVRRVLYPGLRSKFDSREFTQMVWLSFFRLPKHAARLDTSRQFVAYVVEMARHKVFMAKRRYGTLRRDASREVPLTDDCEELVSREPQPVDNAIALETLEQLLKDLPPRDRQIVEMRLQQKTYTEIGAQLKIDPHTAYRVIKKIGRGVFT
jgi:RNA polymerase sigma factor (sigma-70 family)